MLCQFSVKNYKSIRDELTFDMLASAISEHNDRVIKDIDDEEFLPVSVIYGPNGGGKSNVLKAIQTLITMVLNPILATQNLTKDYSINNYPVIPFLFSDEKKQDPTEFDIFFRTQKTEYKYSIEVCNNEILFEKLERIKFETGRRSLLLNRENGEISLKGDLQNLKISIGLSKCLPLLSYLGITYMDNEIVHDVIDWFESRICFLNYGNPSLELKMAIDTSEDIKKLVLKMIKETDLDIEDYRVEKTGNNEVEVFTKHIVDGYKAELNLSEESSGTKKLFGILPFIAKSLLEGNTLVIDELDAKIHPLLLKHIIELFTDMKVNRYGAQLIFTSHDLSTMTSKIFRRDEIWFVAKVNGQNSKLYSLVEFKTDKGEVVRKDAKYDKQYLEGKYGADPYLRKIIDWSTLNV